MNPLQFLNVMLLLIVSVCVYMQWILHGSGWRFAQDIYMAIGIVAFFMMLLENNIIFRVGGMVFKYYAGSP